MTPFRFRHAVAVCALSLSAATLLPSSPALAAAVSTGVEGEHMSATTGRVGVFADQAASSGSALKLLTNATVEGSVTTGLARRLTLRLRGDQFDGAPQVVVRVDNRKVAAFSVPTPAGPTTRSRGIGQPHATRCR